ncbi:hypothetical protein BJP07_05210 [Corynebacterium sp. NML130628]|nr:hypothetical protein BJP07_05210 [Corynebacterium sp. NML130628]
MSSYRPLFLAKWCGIPFIEIALLLTMFAVDHFSESDVEFFYVIVLLSFLGLLPLSLVPIRFFFVDILFVLLGVAGYLIIQYSGETAGVGLGWICMLLLGLGVGGVCCLIRRVLAITLLCR